MIGRILSWFDSTLAAFGEAFMRSWTVVERAYRRPLSRFALRLKFAFYLLLALAALGWLAWDWTHDRSLNAAENAVFDRVVNWRPAEPTPSGRVVVVDVVVVVVGAVVVVVVGLVVVVVEVVVVASIVDP